MPEDVDQSLKHEIEFIIKSNESLAENKIKTRLNKYFPNISMETKLMSMGNSKTNEPNEIVLNLTQRLDLRSSSKHVAV